jgi:hypothetical protein
MPNPDATPVCRSYLAFVVQSEPERLSEFNSAFELFAISLSGTRRYQLMSN